MNELKVDVDAAEAGLDAERLKRVDAHFAGVRGRRQAAGLAADRYAGTAGWRTWPGAGRVTWRRGCR